MKRPHVLAITGASGAIYATRLLQMLLQSGCDVHLTISPSGQAVLKQELDLTIDLDNLAPKTLKIDADVFEFQDIGQPPQDEFERAACQESTPKERPRIGRLTYHHYQNLLAPIASGSFLTAGMVVCPCSGSSLSSIAQGAGSNLIHRAASVHLKERRKLILVPRETPLSAVYLDNMKRAVDGGAVVLPAMPGWYHGVKSLGDLVDFVVARILDQLDIEHALMKRWGSDGLV
jgi:4-hydroxy-3-polyprenylbenzoate decarboxylase